MIGLWIFFDKTCEIFQVTETKVNGWTIPTQLSIFTGKCDYWSTSRSDLRERDLARNVNIEFKDVVVEGFVNTIVVGDEVELIDANTTSIWLFVIYEIDKFPALTWIDNTFMRVRTRDG